MKQLLIQVFCPALSKSYDFWIPAAMKGSQAIEQLCDDICVFENNRDLFADRSGLLLYSDLGQKPLPPGLTLAQAGVKSGDRLALV